MNNTVHEIFTLNRPIIIFVYGLIFFVMGLAIFLQSRRHSRLRLARDLRWLAAFGVLHGIYEWGDVFIPIQAQYLPQESIMLLRVLEIVMLALSFGCLLMFGASALEPRFPHLRKGVIALCVMWGAGFALTFFTTEALRDWFFLSNVWARYLLCVPGSLLAAYGLRYQAETNLTPLKLGHIFRTLQVAGLALVAYAFVGGLMVRYGDFFPANIINRNIIEQTLGIPIEILRSAAGLVLAFTIIRALEIFEIEVDQLIETMEIERIQAAERERIGQEIHDGAIQAIYSASLIMDTLDHYVQENPDALHRLNQTKSVINGAIQDLRSYMVSLRAPSATEKLIPSLQALIADPRFRGLLDIRFEYDVEPDLNPMQVNHVVAILQESLSNTIRHAHARHAVVNLHRQNGGLIFIVEDDGRGFESMTPGYGLRSIRDRARLLGGSLEIDSQPGQGTRIRFTLPEERTHDDPKNPSR